VHHGVALYERTHSVIIAVRDGEEIGIAWPISRSGGAWRVRYGSGQPTVVGSRRAAVELLCGSDD